MSAPPTERQAARQLREKGNQKKKKQVGKKRKKEKQPSKEKENKWDCYISSTLQHFRGSGRLSPFTRSGATAGRSPQARRRLGFLLWHGCLDGGSAGESRVTVHEWPVSWKLQPLHDEFISPLQRCFFFFLSPLHTPTHPASVLYLSERRFNTAALLLLLQLQLPLPLWWKCRPVVMHPVHLKLHRVSFHAVLRPRAPFVHM